VVSSGDDSAQLVDGSNFGGKIMINPRDHKETRKQIERLEAERKKLLKRLAIIDELLKWLKPMPKTDINWTYKRKPGDPSPRFAGVL